MQRFRLLFFWAFSLPTFSSVFASHYMGADITYEQLSSSCTYRIYHKTYYDCSGAATTPLPGPAPAPAPALTITGVPSGCMFSTPTLSWIFVNYTEVTPIAGGVLTACTTPGAAINGVLESTYYADVNLCGSTCTDFTIEWATCCRNYAITSGSSGGGMALHSTTIQTADTNSSPQFAHPPIHYICSGQTTTVSQGATDPDGDSLIYSLGPCFDSNPNTSVTYAAGYSPIAPLGATWNVTLDPYTGDITFDPTPGGAIVVGVIGIYITEYRNGVWVGQVSRDMQVTVLSNCASNKNPDIQAITNLVGGTSSNNSLGIANQIHTSVGYPLSFDIPSTDTDSGQIVNLFWNHNISGATFSDANNASILDTVTSNSGSLMGRFSWTPMATGSYHLLITAVDDYSQSIRGTNQRSYTIYVSSPTFFTGANIQSQSPSCKTLTATASPIGGVPPFNYLWYGNVPNATTASITHTFNDYDNSGVPFIYTVKITDATGTAAFQTDSIIFSKPVANFTINTSGNTTNLQATANGGQSPYSYQWWVDNILQSGQNPSLSVNNLSGLHTFQLIISDAVGCIDSIIQEQNITDIAGNQAGLQSLSIHPNPVQNSFILEGTTLYPQSMYLEITDISGKILLKQNLPAMYQIKEEISVNGLAQGIYFLKISNVHGTKTFKLLKE